MIVKIKNGYLQRTRPLSASGDCPHRRDPSRARKSPCRAAGRVFGISIPIVVNGIRMAGCGIIWTSPSVKGPRRRCAKARQRVTSQSVREHNRGRFISGNCRDERPARPGDRWTNPNAPNLGKDAGRDHRQIRPMRTVVRASDITCRLSGDMEESSIRWSKTLPPSRQDTSRSPRRRGTSSPSARTSPAKKIEQSFGRAVRTWTAPRPSGRSAVGGWTFSATS